MHLGNRYQHFGLLFLMLSEVSGLSFHQISKRGSRSGRVLSTGKDPRRAGEWNPFLAFTDFILNFIVRFLLFSGPGLSLVCQPHGTDVCTPFPASILPGFIPKTWSPCLSLHVLRIPLGQHDYFLLPAVYPSTSCLVKAKFWPQTNICLRPGSACREKHHHME